MSGVTGPVAIGQRNLYLSTASDAVTGSDWSAITGNNGVYVAANRVGKVVEGPNGLGDAVPIEDVPVLGQESADQFSGQPTREQISFTVQARHTDAGFLVLRNAALNTPVAIAYVEKESDTAQTAMTFTGKLVGRSYDGSVGRVESRMTVTFSRSSGLTFIDQS